MINPDGQGCEDTFDLKEEWQRQYIMKRLIPDFAFVGRNCLQVSHVLPQSSRQIQLIITPNVSHLLVIRHVWFVTCVNCKTGNLQHVQFATRAIYNTCNLQHVKLATCVICNMCNLQHVQFATRAICNTCNCNM